MDPAPFRVLTYNIFAGNDLERRSNLARVAALIDTLRADVVLLQEVDRRTRRSGGVDQASVLAEHTGLQAVFARAFDFDGGEYGIAVLTRWRVVSSRVVPYTLAVAPEVAGRAYEPRTLLHVVLDAPGGALHVLNTHLDHQGPASVARKEQVLQLLAYIAEEIPRGATLLLGGDLNATPDAPEVRALGVAFADAWRVCGAGEGFTFRADAPARRIDYVLLRGATCTAARVPERLLSDHRPVLVDVVRRGRE